MRARSPSDESAGLKHGLAALAAAVMRAHDQIGGILGDAPPAPSEESRAPDPRARRPRQAITAAADASAGAGRCCTRRTVDAFV